MLVRGGSTPNGNTPHAIAHTLTHAQHNRIRALIQALIHALCPGTNLRHIRHTCQPQEGLQRSDGRRRTRARRGACILEQCFMCARRRRERRRAGSSRYAQAPREVTTCTYAGSSYTCCQHSAGESMTIGALGSSLLVTLKDGKPPSPSITYKRARHIL